MVKAAPVPVKGGEDTGFGEWRRQNVGDHKTEPSLNVVSLSEHECEQREVDKLHVGSTCFQIPQREFVFPVYSLLSD